MTNPTDDEKLAQALDLLEARLLNGCATANEAQLVLNLGPGFS